jgi:hypothetical protein
MSSVNTEKLIEDNLQNYKDSICDKVRLTLGTAQQRVRSLFRVQRSQCMPA